MEVERPEEISCSQLSQASQQSDTFQNLEPIMSQGFVNSQCTIDGCSHDIPFEVHPVPSPSFRTRFRLFRHRIRFLQSIIPFLITYPVSPLTTTRHRAQCKICPLDRTKCQCAKTPVTRDRAHSRWPMGHIQYMMCSCLRVRALARDNGYFSNRAQKE